MKLKEPIQHVLVQLSETLNQLTNEEYVRPSRTLLNATIGHHVRHIIELFQCLENGYDGGVVNYEKRKRNHQIETDKELATVLLRKIYQQVERPNKELIFEAQDYCGAGDLVAIPSNYYRELTYNLEHTIHHMAMIRVGVNEVSSLKLPDEFGVAHSTVKHRQQCVQ